MSWHGSSEQMMLDSRRPQLALAENAMGQLEIPGVLTGEAIKKKLQHIKIIIIIITII
jgi:hypothetical protein